MLQFRYVTGITPFKPWLSRPLHIQRVVLKSCSKKIVLSLTNSFEILMHIPGSKNIVVNPLKYDNTTRTWKKHLTSWPIKQASELLTVLNDYATRLGANCCKPQATRIPASTSIWELLRRENKWCKLVSAHGKFGSSVRDCCWNASATFKLYASNK